MIQRIAFVTADTGPGGASRAVCRLIGGLSSPNPSFSRYTLLAYGQSELGYELLPPQLSLNPLIRRLQSKSNLLSTCRSWLTNQWEKQVLLPETKHQFFRSGTELDFSVSQSLNSFDLVHFFWCQSYLNLSAVVSLDCPKLVTLHDMWFLTGGCAYSLSCQGFTTGCFRCPNVQRRGQSRIRNQYKLKRNLLNRSDCHVVVTSHWMFRQACQSGLDPHKISIIPNYIPEHYCYLSSKTEYRNLLGWSNTLVSEQIILYFVGSPADPRKGFNLLVEALQLLSPHSLRRIALQVLGSPFKKIDQLEPLGIRYRSLGFMRDEFSQVVAYNAADFLICPSYFDNSPNVIAESLCCGLPALALPGTGGAEMLSHGESGLIPENQSAYALSEVISIILSANYSFDRYAISRDARKTFGHSATCKKYEDLYRQLL